MDDVERALHDRRMEMPPRSPRPSDRLLVGFDLDCGELVPGVTAEEAAAAGARDLLVDAGDGGDVPLPWTTGESDNRPVSRWKPTREPSSAGRVRSLPVAGRGAGTGGSGGRRAGLRDRSPGGCLTLAATCRAVVTDHDSGMTLKSCGVF